MDKKITHRIHKPKFNDKPLALAGWRKALISKACSFYPPF